MKFLKTLRDTLKAAPTKLKVTLGATLAGSLLAGLVIGITSVTSAGFGPSRPVFDWNKPEDRVGSVIGPVFNSFINTPVYGDERAFLDGKDSAITTPGDFKDQLPVEPGKEYLLRMYVHNDANQTTNDDEGSTNGVAKNTRVRIKLLPGFANGQGVTGYISADNDVDKNGNPMGELHDTVDLRNENTRFALDYVEGSARIINDAHPNGLSLSDNIVTDGVPIGYEQMNGDMPGCFEFSAYVTIRVKVVAPELDIEKTVRKAGETEWKESVNAKPGETVQWFVKVTNTGDAQVNNVIARDVLPANVTYVDGSAKWFNPQARDVPYDFAQFSKTSGGGLDFGSYNPDSNFLVRFDTKVNGDFDACSVTRRNVAFASSRENSNEVSDDASVVITKDNCVVTQPAFACKALSATLVKDRTFRFTVDASATNGAKIKHYIYNFGDNTPELVTDKTTVEHTYAANGTFATSVKVVVTVNGKDQVVNGDQCKKTITAGVTSLPKTGAESAVGLFTATTAIGYVGHRLRTLRKLDK